MISNSGAVGNAAQSVVNGCAKGNQVSGKYSPFRSYLESCLTNDARLGYCNFESLRFHWQRKAQLDLDRPIE